MNSSLILKNFEGREIRVVEIEGVPHFVGKDVAEALGYVDTTNAIKQHCRGVVKHHPILDRLGRSQEVRVLAEPDVYRLIAKSALPEAQRFEGWFFEEVLPEIRRTGQYGGVRAPSTLREALLLALEQDATITQLRVEAAAAEPKVAAYDSYMDSSDDTCLLELGKKLSEPPRKLLNRLVAAEFLYRINSRLLPYEKWITSGLFVVRVKPVDGKDRNQTYVTARGVLYFGEWLRQQKRERDLFAATERRA